MAVLIGEPPGLTSASDIVINYTRDPELSGCWMPPSDFFTYEGIQTHTMSLIEDIVDQCIALLDNNSTAIHSTKTERQSFPDLFALTFFALTRYEEYLTFLPDAYGRYPVSQSIWFRKGLVGRALVDEMLLYFVDFARGTLSDKKLLPLQKAEIISTVDIDQAWAYRYKGWRALAGRLKAFDFPGFIHAFKVLFRQERDPFDTYDTIRNLHKMYGRSCQFFILCTKFRSTLDKNHSPLLIPFVRLVGSLSEWAEVGVHPSFRSASNASIITEEKQCVESMCGICVEHSRQHFLLLRFPETYRALLNAGIRHDYSMGWAEHTGFRAGTAFSFPWYDLEREESTALRIHPFQLMDVTLKNYQRIDVAQALDHAEEILQYAKKLHLPLTVIWHNSSLSPTGEWAGWEAVYEKIIRG